MMQLALTVMGAGTQRITLDTVANSPLLHKWNTRRLTFLPLLSFAPLTSTPQEYIKNNVVQYSALAAPVRCVRGWWYVADQDRSCR